MAYRDSEFQRIRSLILRYGFAVVSVVVATAVALAFRNTNSVTWNCRFWCSSSVL
jgi:hypothetical protein